ncbi:hypothetical protein Ahy_B03g064139 [Arachis hypogaea]|uniref:Myb-like domain-containing protein n=1 Tax=Arachis hypogaea TaxID=3818 RepID=A0A444ZYT7_ARAHY|nr:hypothetical protein Ahy_B03g064139 [Arachis hypogaea]
MTHPVLVALLTHPFRLRYNLVQICNIQIFSNLRRLDAIDLNDDDIENCGQDSIQHWHWKEDKIWYRSKGKTFWSQIRSYCIQFNADMKRRTVACKKRWYKINKVVTQFDGCYDQTSRNIRSGSNADDMK